MAQKTSFTAEHCRRITWAILDDGRAHFDYVKTTLDFRGPDKLVFPQSFLIDILHNVCYAIPVECANFPEEWKRKAWTATDNQGECTSGGGSSPLRDTNHPTSQGTGQGMITPRRDFGTPQGYGGGGGHSQYGPSAQGGWWPSYQGGAYQGGQYQGGNFSPERQFQLGGQPITRDWCMGWNNKRHPKIKALMQGYLERTNGQVHLAKILMAAGKTQTDMPTLPKYVHPTGRPFLCWSSVLGRCGYRDCCFQKEGGHLLPADVTDKFADRVIDVIGKGVITHGGPMGGSPPEKHKVGESCNQN
jgi:hypothetical protein